MISGAYLCKLRWCQSLASKPGQYQSGTPFGAVLGGLLTQLTSIRLALLIMASALAISLLIGYFSPLREKTRVRDIIQRSHNQQVMTEGCAVGVMKTTRVSPRNGMASNKVTRSSCLTRMAIDRS